MEIGNIESDLEAAAELCSRMRFRLRRATAGSSSTTGAVPVILAGVVERADPFCVAKFSALGVEEQRVTAVIRFRRTSGSPCWPWLRSACRDPHRGSGSGECRSSWPAHCFGSRANGPSSWSRAAWRGWCISLGRTNGTDAQVLDGLSPGVAVVLYPSSGLVDGVSVARRRVQ